MRKIWGLVGSLVLVPALAGALPLPQPIVMVPKKTIDKLEEQATIQIVKKKKTYKLTNYKRYKLLSGEVFKYVDAGDERTMWVEKVCYYEKDSEGREKLIKCEVVSIR